MHRDRDIRLLCVEDDPLTRELLSSYLKTFAREVITASNGAEGLTAYNGQKPDLVVTDVSMPVMDGIGLIREIRSQDRDAAIVAITVNSEESFRRRIDGLGPVHYVQKPVRLERLRDVLDDCIAGLVTRDTPVADVSRSGRPEGTGSSTGQQGGDAQLDQYEQRSAP